MSPRSLALAAPRSTAGGRGRRTPLPPLGQRIAVARDDAFAFAYRRGARRAGARRGRELSFFSPLADDGAGADDADAVYLPGGYPELHAGALAGAARFRAGLRGAAARGAAIYGECGGYMVLGAALIDASGRAPCDGRAAAARDQLCRTAAASRISRGVAR